MNQYILSDQSIINTKLISIFQYIDSFIRRLDLIFLFLRFSDHKSKSIFIESNIFVFISIDELKKTKDRSIFLLLKYP